MVKIQQTLIVGLGPSGRAALEHFKRRTQETYGELPAVKLVVLDIPKEPMISPESRSSAGPSQLGSTELLELTLDDASLASGEARQNYPWLPASASQELAVSAVQTRVAARLALHVHAQDILRFLEYHIQQLATAQVRDKMAAKGFEIIADLYAASVIVVAGLGDEVGSGLLLDVTYLIQHLYHHNNLHVASTALLFMPSVAPSDPAAEACAYATLKELNRCMGKRGYYCEFPGFVVESDSPPFNRGCYLLGMRNERNVTIESYKDMPILAAEWLFRSLFTPLKSRVDEFVAEQGTEIEVRGQPAVYSSLGITAQVLPANTLIEYCANRLSHEILSDHVLKSAMFGQVAQRLTDFLTKMHLRPDALMTQELRLGRDKKPIQMQSEYITRLRTVPYNQVTLQVQSTLKSIGERMLPERKRDIEFNVRRVLQDVEEGIEQEFMEILRQWPAGGLSLAVQFAERLRYETTRFSQALRRREAADQARNQQLVNYLGRLGPALKNAVASIPSAPIIIGAAIGGLLAPLILTTTWLTQGTSEVPVLLRVLLVLLVWLAGLGGAAYTIWRTIQGVNSIRDQYVTHLNNRFQTELDLALVAAAGSLYPEVTQIIDAKLAQLRRFTAQLTELTRTLKSRLDPAPLCGNIEFALQHSVLTPELVDERYVHVLGAGGAEARLSPLIDKIGPLDTWQRESPEEIEESLLSFGREVFAPVRDLRAEDLLKQQLATPAKAEQLVRKFQDEAAPLWNYDRFSMGEMFVSEARTFVGLANPAESEFRKQFERVDPATIFEASGDPHSLVATSVRSRMPLFGLQRIMGYRQVYLDSIRKGVKHLHTEDELALSPDLRTMDGDSGDLDAPTAVALGRAFGWIKPRPDGVYALSLPDSRTTQTFTADLVDSTILLEADTQLLGELSRRIQNRVAEKGNTETAALLEAHLTKGNASPWEKKRLERYLDLLRG